jgi:hypothetical protein
MHNQRWLLLLCAAALSGCYGPPDRPSPVLIPAELEPFDLSYEIVRDLRRDGVFARGPSAFTTAGGQPREIFVADADIEIFASRADDEAVVVSEERVLRYDGERFEDLSARLRAAVVGPLGGNNGVHPHTIDLAADGTVAVAISVSGPLDAANRLQICTLGLARDECEASGMLAAVGPDFSAGSIVLEGGYLYALDTVVPTWPEPAPLIRRAIAGGSWILLSPTVRHLAPLEGERVAYYEQRQDLSATLYTLGPDGEVERQVEDEAEHLSSLRGHASSGLWMIELVAEGDDSEAAEDDTPCTFLCDAPPEWYQFAIHHVGTEVREVAHVDTSLLDYHFLPLADGSLRIEHEGEVFLLAP